MPNQRKCVFKCEKFDFLHRFPKPQYPNMERFKLWKKIVGDVLEGKDDYVIYHNHRICNLHFEDRFTYPKSKRLARTAIPTKKICKNEERQRLASEINSVNSDCNRSTEQLLKTCSENAQKENTPLRNEILTGGGGGPLKTLAVNPSLGPTEEATTEIIQIELDRDANDIPQATEEVTIVDVTEEDDSLTTNDPPLYVTLSPAVFQPMTEILRYVEVKQDTQEIQNSLLTESSATKSSDAVHQFITENVSTEQKSQVIMQNTISEKPGTLENGDLKQSGSPDELLSNEQLLQSKIKLVEALINQTEEEVKMKKLILAEQLEQEKIKTRILQLKLKKLIQRRISI